MVIPRLIEIGMELEVRFVFFVIARDAPTHARLLREAHAAGHEIASHSFTHPEPFELLDDTTLRFEVGDSKKCLEDVIGSPVSGFRAPGLGLDSRIRRQVAEAGYRYDSSVMPSPVSVARQLVFALRSSRGRGTRLRSALGQLFSPRAPHALEIEGRRLWEFPLAVTPILRYPVYHTLSHLVPVVWHDRAVSAVVDLSYVFHAVDLLDLEGDSVDARLARHPGMRRNGSEKRRRLADIILSRRSQGPIGTYSERVVELEAGASAGSS